MIVKEKNGEGFLDLRICDNLELMAEIKDNTIDLIYCDILYGTGRKFKDYQDLKPIRSEIETHYISRKKRCTGIIFIDGALRLYMDYKNSIGLTVEPNNTAYYSNYYIMFTT